MTWPIITTQARGGIDQPPRTFDISHRTAAVASPAGNFDIQCSPTNDNQPAHQLYAIPPGSTFFADTMTPTRIPQPRQANNYAVLPSSQVSNILQLPYGDSSPPFIHSFDWWQTLY